MSGSALRRKENGEELGLGAHGARGLANSHAGPDTPERQFWGLGTGKDLLELARQLSVPKCCPTLQSLMTFCVMMFFMVCNLRLPSYNSRGLSSDFVFSRAWEELLTVFLNNSNLKAS